MNQRKDTHELRYGLVARIPGSHPGGSGSIPGTGINFFSPIFFLHIDIPSRLLTI